MKRHSRTRGSAKEACEQQDAQENMWKSKRAPQVSEGSAKHVANPRCKQDATEEKSKDSAFQFIAGGTGEMPIAEVAGPSDGTLLTVGLKRKFVTDEVAENSKRVRAGSPEDYVEEGGEQEDD